MCDKIVTFVTSYVYTYYEIAHWAYERGCPRIPANHSNAKVGRGVTGAVSVWLAKQGVKFDVCALAYYENDPNEKDHVIIIPTHRAVDMNSTWVRYTKIEEDDVAREVKKEIEGMGLPVEGLFRSCPVIGDRLY